ncbi:hypothetical protein F4604DRAFT_1675734 [Suillus subluteus]|nr:hypothetical protein F4604DRAFT_1675734 [Suillus subluteus]
MALCKAAPKQKKSKLALSPPAAQPQVLFESQHVVHCQKIKEKWSEKQKKKALKAAYQGQPDIFEQEPSELLSNIDRQEDTMFFDHSIETKLSNANVLTFSTGKIPPRWHNQNTPITANQNAKGPNVPPSNAHLDDALDYTPTLDAGNDDDDESTDEDDHGNTNEQLPAAWGMKRPFSILSEDTVVLKVKKNVDSSCQHVKASDFDEISKEILITACSIYQCLVITQAPFPDSVAAETKLAKEAWHEACQIKGVNVKLTLSVVNVLLKCTSHVRGELKTKMCSLTGLFYGCWCHACKKADSAHSKDWFLVSKQADSTHQKD